MVNFLKLLNKGGNFNKNNNKNINTSVRKEVNFPNEFIDSKIIEKYENDYSPLALGAIEGLSRDLAFAVLDHNFPLLTVSETSLADSQKWKTKYFIEFCKKAIEQKTWINLAQANCIKYLEIFKYIEIYYEKLIHDKYDFSKIDAIISDPDEFLGEWYSCNYSSYLSKISRCWMENFNTESLKITLEECFCLVFKRSSTLALDRYLNKLQLLDKEPKNIIIKHASIFKNSSLKELLELLKACDVPGDFYSVILYNFKKQTDLLRILSIYNNGVTLIDDDFTFSENLKKEIMSDIKVNEALKIITGHSCLSETNKEDKLLLISYEDEIKKFLELNIDQGCCEKVLIENIDIMAGVEFEHFISELYQKMGFKTENTPISNDQGADIIATKNSKKYCIQAKRYSHQVSNTAIQEVVASIRHYNADCGVVVTSNYFTRSAIDLAKSNKIDLVDRDDLVRFIDIFWNA